VPATISHKVNTQNNIHGKFPSQTSERKFPSSGEPVPNNSGGARRAGWFLLQKPFPYCPSLPTATETRKITKKPAFTVSRKIPDSKGLTFANRSKLHIFLSGFSVLIYIFEEITIATNQRQSTLLWVYRRYFIASICKLAFISDETTKNHIYHSNLYSAL